MFRYRLVTVAILVGMLIMGFPPRTTVVQASSHREAPLIAQDQYADNTDTYAFISPTNPNNIVLVASWIPFEGPEGGPNYYEWGKNVLYDIYVDSNGDAKPDFTYTLSTKSTIQNGQTFLYNTGPIGADGTNLNERQYYTVTETSTAGNEVLVNNKLVSPVNIGSKSTPDYPALNNTFIDNVSNKGDQIKVYAGPTDDAFWVDLQVFDLLTLRGQKPPIGYSQGNNSPVDSVAGFNVHSLVLEIPISRLTKNGDPVLGVWAASRRPKMSVLEGLGGLGTRTDSGEPVQVSRLGMPLVNEVVIPLALKDAFNTLKPEQDAVLYTGGAGAGVQQLLQKSVEDPEIGNLLCGLYGVPLPGDANKDCKTEFMTNTIRSGRGDIFDIFLTGMKLAAPFTINTKNGPATLPAGFNVNRPSNPAIKITDTITGVVPAEMIRINTAIKGDLCSPTPSRLGVLGGDACGFPNGRRLTDDIVEIELLAVAGAAYPVLDGRDTSFTFNPDLIGILTDGIDCNDVPFKGATARCLAPTEFPYMAVAQSGQEHIHDNPGPTVPMLESSIANVEDRKDDAEERSNGSVKIHSGDLDLGHDTVGLRFSNVSIPVGATIVNAYIEFVAKDTDSVTTSLVFHGEAVADGSTFAEKTHNISARSMTSTSVAWNNVPAWTQKLGRHWSPNLAPIVQEVVNGGGWTNGNHVNFVVTGSGQRTAYSYDGRPGGAPLLYVEYVMGGASASSAVQHLASDVVSSSILSSDRNLSGPDSSNAGPDEDEQDSSVAQPVKVYLPAITR